MFEEDSCKGCARKT